MNLQLVGKRAPVTGASAGIGVAIAEVMRAIRGPKLGAAFQGGQGRTVPIDTESKGDNTMPDQRPKIAALVADAFQEEGYFFPKIALNEAGYEVEVVSSRKEPVEIYSYFARTGVLDVERAIMEARPEDYVGVLIPGGAKSPALLAEDPRVTKFVQDVSARGGVIACICRGSMLAARSKVVAGRRMTGFNDSVSYPELAVQPDAEAAGATWVQDAPVVVDRNLVTSPHPRHSAAFSAAIVEALRSK
jgi:protease I